MDKSEKKPLSGTTGFISDAACAVVLSSALLLVLLTLLGHDSGLWECLVFSAVSSALVFVFSRRWWLLPALLAGIALLGGALIAVLTYWDIRLWPVIYEYSAGFVEWWSDSWPTRMPYSANGSIELVRLAFAVPVTALVWLFFRKLFFFPLLPAGCAALMFFMYRTQMENRETVLAFFAVVIISGMAKMTVRRHNRARPPEEHKDPGTLQLPALLLAFFIMLMSFAFSPQTDGALRSYKFINFIDDVTDWMDFRFTSSYGAGGFSMNSAGYTPDGGKMGGDVELNNDKTLFIKTEHPVLLSAKVYDTYSGNAWYDSQTIGSFRWDSTMWAGRRRTVFGLNLPLGGWDATRLYDSMTVTTQLTVNPQISSRSLFTGGSMFSLSTKGGVQADVNFNLQSEIFADEPWTAFKAYTIETVVFDRNRPDFDENMRLLELMTADKKDRKWEEVCKYNLQLPDDLPEDIPSLAELITKDFSDPYDKAAALESWLAENCRYTLTPGSVPDGEDFVGWFLSTREGYCEYYASAMTVLARCAGLPARYCVGFAMRKNNGPGAYDYAATNATAHAWTQVYFYGIGWVCFDALRWNFEDSLNDEPPVPAATPAASPAPTPAVPEPPVLPTPLPELPSEPDAGGGTRKGLSTPGILLLCALAALALFFAARVIALSVSGKNYYRRLMRRCHSPGERLDAAYSRLLRQLSDFGIQTLPDDTISSFGERADKHFGNDRISRVLRPVILHRFALEPARDSDVARLCDCICDNESLLKNELGRWRWFWSRAFPPAISALIIKKR